MQNPKGLNFGSDLRLYSSLTNNPQYLSILLTVRKNRREEDHEDPLGRVCIRMSSVE